jgi:molybdenum cofactor synthesis domain-containing protein
MVSLLAGCGWAEVVEHRRVRDDRRALAACIAEVLSGCDALLVSGGVSMGTHDFVPGVLRESGCEVVFHRLAIRPGMPVLGAIGPGGEAVFGLPGNPVSVMTTARRIAMPVLMHRGGCTRAAAAERVVVENPDGRALKLWWSRPVVRTGAGRVRLVETRGSGDVVSAARSEGFVEVPPGESGAGPWDFYAWRAG